MTPEWLRIDLDVVQSVGAEAAMVLALIRFRSHDAGCWSATREQIGAAVHLNEYRTKKALAALRDAALLASERADRFRPDLVWRPQIGAPAEKSNIAVTCGSESPSPVRADIAVSSLEESQEELPLVVPTAAAPTKRSRRKPEAALPDDLRPTDGTLAFAQKHDVDLRAEWPRFVAYHQSKDTRSRDWQASLRTWILNQVKYRDRDNVTQLRPAPTGGGYDPEWERRLPPPRTDPFAARDAR